MYKGVFKFANIYFHRGCGENYMENYKKMYEDLQREFEIYQNFAETNIQQLNQKNQHLNRDLDATSNIMEISNYINSYLHKNNLISMINDTIMGVFGVNYSSIYIKEDDRFVLKASNKGRDNFQYFKDERFDSLLEGEPFIINSKVLLFKVQNSEIHSILGIPITLRNDFIGYIIVEHTLYNFFECSHIKFMTAIANQVAVAIENNELYRKMRTMANKDPLLNVFNRRYFINKVNKYIQRNSNKKFALVMLDFDNFKMVNDTYGHNFGDLVLKESVKLISREIRRIGKVTFVGRYGGEEIVIFIQDVDDYNYIYSKMDYIRRKISENIITDGKTSITITVSIGVAYYPEDGTSEEDVLKEADALCYKTKNNGRNGVSVSRR
jgi:diguanylate cyclase (GGDEF)-like protein